MTTKKATTNDLSYFRMKEREIVCPHCRTNLIVGSPMDTIFMAKETCPKCKKDFIIENDVAKAAA